MENIVDIYVRLSDEDRNKQKSSDESESITNQKAMLVDYCEKRNWIINAIYCDDNYSGTDRKRPGFNLLLKDCENKKCNIVLCKTQSRFSRDMEMIEKYIHGKFSEWGIRFISVVDNGDTNIKENKKSRQINGLINEWYLEDLSENIKATLKSKRKNGDFVGSFAPYGYTVDKNNKNRLVIDEIAANTVKQIFNMYLNGYSYTAIAKELTKRCISTPYERKKELGLKYYNPNCNSSCKNVWTCATVSGIIKRYEYTGALVQGRQTVANYKTGYRRNVPECEWDIVENMHEPIISKETFKAAQEKTLSKAKPKRASNDMTSFLSVKVFCGECGKKMAFSSYTADKNKYEYYVCNAEKHCNKSCQIKTETLKQIITAETNKLLKAHSEKVLNPKPEYYDEKINKIELNKKIAKTENKIKQLYLDMLDNLITKEQYLAIKKDFSDKIQDYKNALKLYDTNKKNSSINQDNIKNLIEKIDVFNTNCNNERPIKIYWKI